MRNAWLGLGLAATLAVSGASARAAEQGQGKPDLKSAGALTFGANGTLFVGDTQGAAIFAIETGDKGTPGGAIKVENIDQKVADLLATDSKQVIINDVAVNPATGAAFLSVSRGRGPSAVPAIVRVDASGKAELVDLANVKYSKASLKDVPNGDNPRTGRAEAITDLAFVDGQVFVAGLSNEEFSSRFLSIPYPFSTGDAGSSIEIFHGAHGKFETKSPIRTFVAYKVKGEPHILAAYTCTPLVKIPVASLKPGAHVKGTTIAELGNRNKPLDLVVYQKDGKDYLLMANSARGVMKIPTEGVPDAEGIVKPVRSEKAGVSYETIAGLKGVQQLDLLDKGHALVLIQGKDGLNLETVDLP